MRFFLVILTVFTILMISATCRGIPDVAAEELYLVRILSIDREQNLMMLKHIDRVNGDKEEGNGLLLYRFREIPKALEKGHLIRIWGTVAPGAEDDFHGNGKEGRESGDTQGDSLIKSRRINVIKGKIAGLSSGEMPDPTGVRKRLKRKMGRRPLPPRGGKSGRP